MIQYNHVTESKFASMSVLPRGFECRSAAPRYGCVKGEYSIYYKRPCYGQPRPQPFQKEVAPYYGGPSNAPRERLDFRTIKLTI